MTIRRLARNLALCAAFAVGIVSMAACPPKTPPDPPVMLSLEVPTTTLGVYSGVTPAVMPTKTTPANYFVLPLLTTTSPIVRVLFTTVFPADLAVTATDVGRGGQAVTLPQLQSGSAMPATGAFQVVNVTAANPATWHIVVRYPNSFQGSKLISTAITDSAGGLTSEPLTFRMSFRGSTVTVSIVTTDNDGMVTSNPQGINCPSGACSADFTTVTSVALSQSVLHNQTEFIGWTGGCTGMGNCTVQLLAPGTAIIPVNPSVTANFRIHSNSQITPPATSCPMPTIMGMTFVEPPNCGSPPPLGATLQCDPQGYFCCGVSGGTPTPRCPGGNQTSVTCAKDNMGVTPGNEILIQPGGCYVSSP